MNVSDSDARTIVLARIAQAHLVASPPDIPYATIARDYRTTSDLTGAALVERFVDRLLDYKAMVRHCVEPDLIETVDAALANRGVHTVVVPEGIDAALVNSVDVRVDDRVNPLSVPDLDGVDGVLTTCAVAVAETGTLVLDGSAGMGRRAVTLIPDYHLCIVRAEQIVVDVPQALSQLDPARPITMISGPSATSDIELNRVEGVHGPRTLEVIVVVANRDQVESPRAGSGAPSSGTGVA